MTITLTLPPLPHLLAGLGLLLAIIASIAVIRRRQHTALPPPPPIRHRPPRERPAQQWGDNTPDAIGQYRIIEKLGSGGAATTYRAFHTILQREVVAKVLHTHLLATDASQRLVREGRVLAQLQHPAIPKVIEIVQEPNGLALIEELVDGQILSDVIRDAGGALPPATALRIVAAIGSALDYAHERGAIHHDIKPENILVSNKDKQVYLLDFGLAVHPQLTAMTQQGDLLGTPTYMSPEQAQGERGDARSDIYSLGIVVYEMFTGTRPFDTGTPHGTLMQQISAPPPRPNGISDQVAAVIYTALEKSPRRRYQSAGALAQALHQAVAASVATGHDSLTTKMSPRGQVITEIKAALGKGQHVLVDGLDGMGKSHILGQLAHTADRSFFLAGIGAKKATLLTLAEQLFADSLLGDEYVYFVDWDDVYKRINRLAVPQLADLVTQATATADPRYLLVLDQAGTLTAKTVSDIVLPLLRTCTVLAAVDSDRLTPTRRRGLQSLIDKCKRVELPPLTDSEVRAILWNVLDKDAYPHWQAIEAKVLDTAAGRPGAVVDLAQKLVASGGALSEVRDLEHSASRTDRVSLLTPALLILITLVMAGRFLARGMNDPLFYLIGSMAYVLVMVLRPILFRRRR